jgi:CheY-like chemotaxis protein
LGAEVKKTLLVVYDNEPFAQIICEVARRRHWACRIFKNGRMLVDELISVDLPALLLLDVLMPELDGIETISELRKTDFRLIRVRFMTGGDPRNSSAAALIASSLTFDVGGTLHKPVSIQEIDMMLLEEEGYLRQFKRDAEPG